MNTPDTLVAPPQTGGAKPTPPLQLPELNLEFCRLSDHRYQNIRQRHYVPNRGVHGQQIHFLIWYKTKIVGIISGCSPVYATAKRDKFFSMTKETRESLLNGVINNLLFRLEFHEPNLATRVLALWRRAVVEVWQDLYSVSVFGFETLVDQVRYGGGERPGSLYKADNWVLLGETFGNTKQHGPEGLAGGLQGKKHQRRNVPKKLIYCRWVDNKVPIAIPSRYVSSWRNKTPEEKNRATTLSNKRKDYLGCRFFFLGKRLYRRQQTDGC